MGKSEQLFHGYCETLREMLDKMSDEEFEREAKGKQEMLDYIGYKRTLKEKEQ
jgi:hypothetical protein